MGKFRDTIMAGYYSLMFFIPHHTIVAGYYGFTLDVHVSVHLSVSQSVVCPSVRQSILLQISEGQILASNIIPHHLKTSQYLKYQCA